MGRLICSTSVSLDGFVETPTRSLDWVLVEEELHAFFNDEAHASVARVPSSVRSSIGPRSMARVTTRTGVGLEEAPSVRASLTVDGARALRPNR